MKMPLESYVKFRAEWQRSPISPDPRDLQIINRIRRSLKERGMIGALADGCGYGNISLRLLDNTFLITASATGHLKMLDMSALALVESADIAKNSIVCRGLRIASSESLSHAACYQSNPFISAVIHIHHAELWKRYYSELPCTEVSAAYGTVEMAKNIAEIVCRNTLPRGRILMGGHPDGLLSYADEPDTALNLLLEL